MFFTAALASFSFAFPAFATEVSQLQITGGYWYLQNDAPPTLSVLAPGPNAIINTLVAPLGGVDAPVVTGEFFNSPLKAYISELVPVTAEINGSSISIDLSGWEKWWNGTSYSSGGVAVGSAYATGTQGLYDFSVSWSATDIGGATAGFTNYWTLYGYAQVVPEPNQTILLLAGIGLVAVRLRKAHLAFK